MDWTETKMGGEVETNVTFTRAGALYFYWPMMNKYARQKSISDIIGTNARNFERAFPIEIPSLLLGERGYFGFTSLKQGADVTVEGVSYFSLAGKDRQGDSYEMAIDKSTYAIVQVKEVQLVKGSTANDAKKRDSQNEPGNGQDHAGPSSHARFYGDEHNHLQEHFVGKGHPGRGV